MTAPRRLLLLVIGLAALASPSPAHAWTVEDFGRCLTRNGEVVYGASWCPHCRNQRLMLGEAMSQVRYVECAVEGDPGQSTSACRDAGVHSYPTWIFADGSRASGELPVERLAAKTGCALPGGTPHGAAPPPAAPPHGHVKIIEVPN